MNCKDHVIQYILVNSRNKKDVLACLSDAYGEEVYFYTPYGEEKARCAVFYDIGEDFFELLSEYDIVKVSLDTHRGLWNYVEEEYEYSQEVPENLNKYLLYCKKKHITLRLLRKMSGKDTMRFLKD